MLAACCRFCRFGRFAVTCDLQAIRERDDREYPTAAFPTTAILDRHALLSEVDRLRAAIEQHRTDMWDEGMQAPSIAPADQRLYAALEEQ